MRRTPRAIALMGPTMDSRSGFRLTTALPTRRAAVPVSRGLRAETWDINIISITSSSLPATLATQRFFRLSIIRRFIFPLMSGLAICFSICEAREKFWLTTGRFGRVALGRLERQPDVKARTRNSYRQAKRFMRNRGFIISIPTPDRRRSVTVRRQIFRRTI